MGLVLLLPTMIFLESLNLFPISTNAKVELKKKNLIYKASLKQLFCKNKMGLS